MAETSKIVLITGASSGIGAACAKVFHENGFKVINFDRQAPETSENVMDFINVELSKPAEIQQAFNDFTSKYGRLDVLVNNAAWYVYKTTTETSIDEFQKVININTTAPFLLAKLAYPLLKKSKGAIINISSVHALATTPKQIAYAASKGAIIAMGRVLALEFAPEVRVNTVLPGAIDTPLMRDNGKRIISMMNESKSTIDEYVEELGDNIPAGRVGEAKEIGETIYFLADSTKSSYITGQTITVDGGMLAQLPGHT